VPWVVYFAVTGDPVPVVLLPNFQVSVPAPLPVKVHVATLQEPEVIFAGEADAATVTGPAVEAAPHPMLLHPRTA